MKIIGRTEEGARLVEISTEEIIALNAAAQALNSINLSCVIVTGAAPLGPPVKEQPTADPPVVKKTKILTAKPSPAGQRPDCLWCKKPLPANANPRTKAHKGKCKTMYAREYARNYWRRKHGMTNPRIGLDRKPINIEVGANPSNPALTDMERKATTAIKEKRLALIKTAAERTAEN